MNKVFLTVLSVALLLALFFPLKLIFDVNVLELPHHLMVSKESFLIIFAAFFALRNQLKVVPLLAVVLGAFFSGPLITISVASLLIYERMQKSSSWWFSFKDLFSLILIVVSSALPEPVRSAIMVLGVVGVSMDFGMGAFSLLPAVLFSHTMLESEISGETAFIMFGIVIFLHIIWLFLNDPKNTGEIWKNGFSITILAGSLIAKDQGFLPAILTTVLAGELIDHLQDENETRRKWVIGIAISVCVGLPIFVTQFLMLTLVQKELMWATPILPFVISFLGFSKLNYSNQTTKEEIYPWWSIFVLIVVAFNGFWWSSIFSPGTDLLDFGTSTYLMAYLFDLQRNKYAAIEQNQFLIVQGLVLFGAVAGYALQKFFKAKEKVNKIEVKLNQLSAKFSNSLENTENVVTQRHNWITEKFSFAKTGVEDVIQYSVVCLCAVLALWIIFQFIKNGAIV